MKAKDASVLEDEYRRLVEGLQAGEDGAEDEDFMSNPGASVPLDSVVSRPSPDALPRSPAVLPQDLLQEAVPGNIRRAEHFTAFLARFVEYLKVRTVPLFLLAARSSPVPLDLADAIPSLCARRPACACSMSSPRRRCRSSSTCATSRSSSASRSSASSPSFLLGSLHQLTPSRLRAQVLLGPPVVAAEDVAAHAARRVLGAAKGRRLRNSRRDLPRRCVRFSSLISL